MKILVFGQLTDIIGQHEYVMESIDEMKVSSLRQQLLNNYPALLGKKYLIAVNKKMADDNAKIEATDEIALLPPFSGG